MIIKLIEEITVGRVILGPGTLYGALKVLQIDEAIKAVGSPEGGRNKKHIRLLRMVLLCLKVSC